MSVIILREFYFPAVILVKGGQLLDGGDLRPLTSSAFVLVSNQSIPRAAWEQAHSAQSWLLNKRISIQLQSYSDGPSLCLVKPYPAFVRGSNEDLSWRIRFLISRECHMVLCLERRADWSPCFCFCLRPCATELPEQFAKHGPAVR